MKKINIKLKGKFSKQELIILWEQGQTLLEILQKNNIALPHSCHGNGTCGKCKVKILSGDIPVTETERNLLSAGELEQGIRLACKVKAEDWKQTDVSEEISIELEEETDEDIIIEGSSLLEKKIVSKTELCAKKTKSTAQSNLEAEDCFIAIDIGTTTIAMALVEEETEYVRDVIIGNDIKEKPQWWESTKNTIRL